jgi:hypothetical protein
MILQSSNILMGQGMKKEVRVPVKNQDKMNVDIRVLSNFIL